MDNDTRLYHLTYHRFAPPSKMAERRSRTKTELSAYTYSDAPIFIKNSAQDLVLKFYYFRDIFSPDFRTIIGRKILLILGQMLAQKCL